jgi:hypothetical protein
MAWKKKPKKIEIKEEVAEVVEEPQEDPKVEEEKEQTVVPIVLTEEVTRRLVYENNLLLREILEILKSELSD